MLLDPHCGGISAGVSVLGPHHGGDAGLPVVSHGRVGHVGPEEDDGLVEDLWSDGGDQNGVDPAQLDVDLETEVRECLGRSLVNVLGLDTLSRHPQQSVPHSLHLGVHRSLAGQHHHHQLEGGEGALEVPEHRLHLVRSSGVLTEAGLADDGHAHVTTDLLQLLSEVPQSVLPDSPLWGEAGDGPLLDVDPAEELLAPHVPDPLVR